MEKYSRLKVKYWALKAWLVLTNDPEFFTREERVGNRRELEEMKREIERMKKQRRG